MKKMINNITRMLLSFMLIALAQSECELPNMSAGHFNLTSEKQLKDIMKKEPAFLIGISASWCEECCTKEPIYQQLVNALNRFTPRIPLLRLNIATGSFIKKYLKSDHDTVPQVIGVRKGDFFKYNDLFTAERLLRFADRLFAPVQYLNNATQVLDFLQTPGGKFDSLRIIGMLYDSDLRKDFENAMGQLCNWFSTEIRAVTNQNVIKEVKSKWKDLPYYNAIIILRKDDIKILDLEVPQDILKWIAHNSVALVDELTPYNFKMYEAAAVSMVIMFVDPKDKKTQDYLQMFTRSARINTEKAKYTWLDGTNKENILKKKKTRSCYWCFTKYCI